MTETKGRLQVYLAHRSALIDYATPLVGSRAHAEDVVQEAYIRFVPEEEAQGQVRRPASYLYRIVRNLAVDMLRGLSAESRRDAAYAQWLGPAPVTPSTEQELLHRDELAQVAAALAQLPDARRIAFEMHRFGGATFHEIARHLNVSPATAHRMVQEALMHVMRHLAQAGGRRMTRAYEKLARGVRLLSRQCGSLPTW